MGILSPLGILCARARALPACLELQLLLSGAEDVLHLVLGNGLPLPRVLLEDVVPDNGNLVGEAKPEEGLHTARLNTLWYRGIWGTGVQPALGMR